MSSVQLRSQVPTFNTSLNDMSPLAISLPPYQKASAYLQQGVGRPQVISIRIPKCCHNSAAMLHMWSSGATCQ